MSRAAATRPDGIRRHNLSVMLAHVHRDGALSRAELTQRLGVSRSTVGALVADLTSLGLVEEVVPTGGAGVGRPSHVITPHSMGPHVIAIDIDIAHVTVAAVGLGGSVLARELVATHPGDRSPETVARLASEAAARLAAGAGLAGRACGIGVSVPGTVDRRTGRVGVAPNLDWHDTALGALLAEAAPTGLPIEVGNDADLAVLAEHQRGSARDCDDVVFLMGRIGVGAGIIADGAPLRGHDGHAGEIGHNVVDPTGPRCHCGKAGCMETYVGYGALLAHAGRDISPTDEGVDEAVDALFDDARAGDAAALLAVRSVAEPLGRAIASLVNTLNPQRVLLGGSLTQVLDLARAEIEASFADYSLEAPARGVQLERPALGSDSALLGAAELAFAALLADPLAVGALSA